MAVKISPPMRQQFEDANGNPYVGGKLYTYAAGSTTKQSTFTDSTGLTANANPIILDSAGRTPFGVWLTAGLNYKFVLSPATDTDPPTSPIFTEDVIAGVNDTSSSASQWVASSATPTYIGATQFTLVGDKTADFHVGRRLKFTVTAGTVYGMITVSTYTTLTTVTVVMDSGALDTGLSAVELSILTNTGSAIPSTAYFRTLMDDADAATARATLGAEPTLLVDYTVPAVTTSITFSGLDLQVHKGYRVEVDYGDGANTLHPVFMYVNGLTTNTDYYTQYVHADGASASAARDNSAVIFVVDINNRTKAGIDIYGVDTFLMATSVCARTIGSGLKVTTYSWARTPPTDNITSLTFTAGVANGISAGSRFRIYRKDR